MPKLKNFGLYFITDSTLTKKSVIDDVNSAIKAGAKVIQYREKDKPISKMIKEASKIKKLCKKNNILFLINDRIDIAMAVDADGAHLGQGDIPYSIARKMLGKDKIIGVTVHNVEEAAEAEKLGADYVGLSPIFNTTTKKDAGKACGTEIIKKIRDRVKIPIVAIGGIKESNINEVLEAGAKNIAIISAIIEKDDVEKAARHFVEKINSYNSNL